MVVVTGGGEETESKDFKGVGNPESVGSSNQVYEKRRYRRPTGEDEFEDQLGGGEEGEGSSRSRKEEERDDETGDVTSGWRRAAVERAQRAAAATVAELSKFPRRARLGPPT